MLLIAILCATFLDAQANSGKGKQMLDQAIAALGGEKFLHMQNRIESGRVYSFFREQLNGLDIAKIYTEYLARTSPNVVAVREREVFGKKQDWSILFLPNQGWDITYRGARPISQENWDRYVRTIRNDVFYILRCRYDEPGMEFDYMGTDVLFSTHVEIVDITDASGQTVRVFLDHNTMLPIHQSFSWLDPDTRYHNDEVTDFQKYRDSGGVMWPWEIERQRNGYRTYQIFSDDVKIDQPLAPKLFELPANARVLKRVD